MDQFVTFQTSPPSPGSAWGMASNSHSSAGSTWPIGVPKRSSTSVQSGGWPMAIRKSRPDLAGLIPTALECLDRAAHPDPPTIDLGEDLVAVGRNDRILEPFGIAGGPSLGVFGGGGLGELPGHERLPVVVHAVALEADDDRMGLPLDRRGDVLDDAEAEVATLARGERDERLDAEHADLGLWDEPFQHSREAGVGAIGGAGDHFAGVAGKITGGDTTFGHRLGSFLSPLPAQSLSGPCFSRPWRSGLSDVRGDGRFGHQGP